MSFARRAVIDVGTNSVKLLVAEINGTEVRPIIEDSQQTRLGQGFYETRRLQSDPILQTAQAVAHFTTVARDFRAESVRAIATSAARDAVNSQDLITAIESASGLRIEIISGEQEAEWAFQGVATDPELRGRALLILDIGGGSTEFILGQGEHKHFRASFPLGTVRLLERLPHSDPPRPEELAGCRQWLKDFLRQTVRPQLEPALKQEIGSSAAGRSPQLVGTGGTTTILGRMEAKLNDYDRRRIEGARLSLERVRWHLDHLWSLRLADRERVVGLPSKRADVILTGTAICEAVMEEFQFSELRVSTRGLRFAAVMAPSPGGATSL
jgi:exopolyphosphatase/guanosine-5'-triphosphate,3'-diphosphate pyrophosphatase